jgi:hypothetical protein
MEPVGMGAHDDSWPCAECVRLTKLCEADLREVHENAVHLRRELRLVRDRKRLLERKLANISMEHEDQEFVTVGVAKKLERVPAGGALQFGKPGVQEQEHAAKVRRRLQQDDPVTPASDSDSETSDNDNLCDLGAETETEETLRKAKSETKTETNAATKTETETNAVTETKAKTDTKANTKPETDAQAEINDSDGNVAIDGF